MLSEYVNSRQCACVRVCLCTDEKQLLEFQQQEVDTLQSKVTLLRTELKTEMKHARQLNEAHVRHSLLLLFFTTAAVAWQLTILTHLCIVLIVLLLIFVD